MDPTLKFKKYLLYSICFHAVVFILFLVLAGEKSIKPTPVAKITMINLTPRLGSPRGSPVAPPAPPPVEKPQPAAEAQKVPEKPAAPRVAEPKKVEPAKKTPEKKEGPKAPIGKKEKTPPPPKPRTPKVKEPDQADLNKALSGIEQQLEERERQLNAPSPPTPVEGTSTGTPALGSPEGQITARDPGFARYQSSVRSKIIRHWVRTHAGEETQRLRARVVVRINASGSVISKQLTRRSGNASFDNSALRAVERASPFPPPPPGVKAEALREGFVVDFSSRVLGSR